MTVEPSPGPWEGYAARFDDLFRTRARCQGFRRYLEGLLLSAERNETLTVRANTEPVVEAQRKGSESALVPLVELLLDDPKRPRMKAALRS